MVKKYETIEEQKLTGKESIKYMKTAKKNLSEANEANRDAIVASAKAIMVTNRLNTPITITAEVVQINNFREYWVWLNLFNYLTASNTTTFIGYQFTL